MNSQIDRLQAMQEHGHKGFALYTTRTLRRYDLVVTQLSNRLIWRCPPSVLVQWYRQHAAPIHADIGPGTGYYLEHSGIAFSSLTLLDANTDACTFAAHRLAKFKPSTRRVNILDAAQVDRVTQRFDSIGLNYVLHCLPGSLLNSKADVLGTLSTLLNPGGVLFGATLLGDLPHSLPARTLLRLYNARGIFANTTDTVRGLTQILNAHYREVQLNIVGSVALFAARAAA